jgi:hypothetical protein
VIAGMNEGLRSASGTHVLGAAADDWIEPELMARSMECFDRHPDAGVCSALTRLANEDGLITGSFRTPVPRWTAGYVSPAQAADHLVRDDTWFNGNTTIVNRVAAIAAGGYRPELASFCDGFLNAQLACQYGACFIPRFLAVWRRLEMGYATSTNADPSKTLCIFEAMQRILRTETSSMPIPEEYFRRWSARWQFSAARSAISANYDSHKRLLSMVSPGLRPVVAVLVRMARISPIGRDAAVAFLFVLFRFRDIEPALRRRVEWIIFGRNLGDLYGFR